MSLHCVTGPMKSSKSSTLLSRVNTFGDVNTVESLVINHILDTRDVQSGISSHSSMYKGIGRLAFIKTDKLSSVDVTNYTNIGIDEVQFFMEDDLMNTVEKWVANGKHIICSGLDGNVKMAKFGHIADLLPMAETFVKLNAICDVCRAEVLIVGGQITPMNQTPAAFTRKLIPDDKIIDVGGKEKYLSVCRKHFHSELNNDIINFLSKND